MKTKWIPIALRIMAGLAAVALVAVMLLQASDSADLDTAQKVEKTPISFTPQVGTIDALQKVAENDAYVLYANLCDPEIRLERRSDGAVVSSRPLGIEESADIKKAEQLKLSSLLNIRYANRDSLNTLVYGSTGSVSRKNFAAKTIENGVRFDFYFANEGFLVPLEVTLTPNGLHASVPLEEIQEASPTNKLTDILPLPNFCAGSVGTAGYAVVPDGSGAIIPFAYDQPDYLQRIYGDDMAVGKTTGTAPAQTARLPIFGITDTKTAVLGIITEGDARARLSVLMPDSNPYATAGVEFVYREQLTVSISQQTFDATQANMFEPEHCHLERFAVEYRMPQEANYVGMANAYRQYLMEDKGMKATAGSSALQIQVIGGVMHEENILGIPVDRVLPVTSYTDTLDLIAALNQRGVGQISLHYRYWSKNGTQSRLTTDMKAEPRLGGTTRLRQLLDGLTENTQVYFDLNFVDLMQNQPGYSTLYSTAQNVKKEPLIRQNFFLSTYREKKDGAKVFLLNPAELSSLVERWQAQYAKKWQTSGMNGLALDNMGREIYSHFGDQPLDRGSVQPLWEQTIQTVAQQSKDGLLLTAANAYALPYATTVQSVPVEHSHYRCEARAIPFYAMALHGLVDMSVPPVNDGKDNLRVLQAVESGIGLTYTLGWRNTDLLKNTAGEQYNYINAAHWLDEAAQQQAAIQPYLAAVSGRAITAHTALAEGVYRTTFEGGAYAIVNYTDTAYTADGITVAPNNYLTGGY